MPEIPSVGRTVLKRDLVASFFATLVRGFVGWLRRRCAVRIGLILQALPAVFATRVAVQLQACKAKRHRFISTVLMPAGIPVIKELNGLSRSDGKRPDGLSLIPWQEGKPVCWDVTVTCPLANS